MRVIYNRDEVPVVRKLIQDELDAGSTMISLLFKMDREDAKRLLANSSDSGPPIEIVWSGVAITAAPR